MIFTPTSIEGVTVIDIEPVTDDRGHFARWYCTREFAAHGLEAVATQGAVSRNNRRGTLRGLHFIPEQIGEAKLVRCLTGAIFDVAVDLRPGSITFRQWFGLELDGAGQRALYLPRGCAHGFLTLTDAVDIAYQFSKNHRPGVELGLRWNDPDIGIAWPSTVEIMSERDRMLPLLRDLPSEG